MTYNKFYYFLIFLLIAISGNPAALFLGKEVMYIGTFAVFIVLRLVNPRSLTRHDVRVLGSFGLITIFHVAIFGSMAVTSSIGFLIRLGIAFLSIKMIPEFSRRYVSVMYALSIISLVFFIPYFLGIDMKGMFAGMRIPLGNDVFHIGLNNFRQEYFGDIRNAGMFWEPGAFAGYLILALFFLIRDDDQVLSRQGCVLIATVLTTQSTTGYLALIVLVIYYFIKKSFDNNTAFRWIGLPILLVVLITGSFYLLNQVSFLGVKIIAQSESAKAGEDRSRINRIGNFLYDIKWIADSPLIGWSANHETRLSTDSEVLDLVSGQGNGLTGFAIRFGLTGLILFLGFFAYSTRRISGSLQTAMFGVVVVCVLLTGEEFLGFPLFLSLMFLPQAEEASLGHNTTDVYMDYARFG